MFRELELGGEFFVALERADAAILAAVAAAGCARCSVGRLHRSDYDRKPRGGLCGAAGERFVRRFSLCCDREGCRRRATPPSLRFLGRRVYLGAVVLVAAMVGDALARARDVRVATGVPARTVGRWLGWWRGPFTATAVFIALASRLVPAVAMAALPASLLARLAGDAIERVAVALRHLAPLTTASVPDGSRFVRGVGPVIVSR
ncbi:MAG: hypothetical protein IT379_15110 [Deltaproteobacteria bacterium]|nr:hypothetical protein [Deltaproteobacteria bacterium]